MPHHDLEAADVMIEQQRTEIERLTRERDEALVLVRKIAGIQLWRDVYPDGPDIWETHPNAHISVSDVHTARALISVVEQEGTK